jgi:hypothetical protein
LFGSGTGNNNKSDDSGHYEQDFFHKELKFWMNLYKNLTLTFKQQFPTPGLLPLPVNKTQKNVSFGSRI